MADISNISHRDQHVLNAVSGWLMLGNTREAMAEFGGLTPEARLVPEVMEVEWGIHAEIRDWDQALVTARKLVDRDPDRAFGYIHQAYAMRRASGGGLQAAWDVLMPAASKFPKVPLIPYNLACYAAQMERTEEAWELLQRALSISEDANSLKKQALADDDLQTLWERLRKS